MLVKRLTELKSGDSAAPREMKKGIVRPVGCYMASASMCDFIRPAIGLSQLASGWVFDEGLAAARLSGTRA
jgi:hypothetical protein